MSIFKIKFIILTCIFNNILFALEDIGEVVITPNRSIVELSKVGSSVLIIEKEQIENSASTTTSGILQEFGGFSVSTKGNKGSDPSYFNRGLSRKYIKVLVDGMDLSDITSTQEEPTYIDNIAINNIDNIEILNGSQGTLYGSNAIGGVISFNSSLPKQYGLSNSSSFEAGQYGSIKTSHSVDYLNENFQAVMNIDGERSSGYSSFINTSLAPFEKDGYYLYGSNFLSSIKMKENLNLNFNGRFYKQHNDYDDAYSYPGDSLTHFRDDKVYALLFNIIYNQKNISHKLTYQPTYTTRINTISGTPYEYDGRKDKIEYILSKNILGFNMLSGLDYLKKEADLNGTIAEKEVYSFFSELRYKIFNSTFIDASLRREFDTQYDTFDTGRLQINNKAFDNIIFRGSLGTGYRTPTPYELYSSYGNTDLTPEKSISYDLGSEINFGKYFTSLYLGTFETKVEDLITFGSKYEQSTGNLKTYGYEFRFKTSLYNFLTSNFNYTKTHGKESDGDSIKLVPKDKFIFSLNFMSKNKINFKTYYLYQNKSKDPKYNELPTYKSLNLNANYLFSNNSKVYMKLENLLDRKNVVNRGGGTTENLGYRSPGRSLYFGIRFTN